MVPDSATNNATSATAIAGLGGEMIRSCTVLLLPWFFELQRPR
jgi:hypothetical protein